MKRPDDITIERWMSGRLEGDDLESIEAWASENASELTEFMNWSATGEILKGRVAAEIQPPYPDFFNSKIRQMVEEGVVVPADRSKSERSFWQRFGWIVAPAAVAGMVLCFYVGSSLHEQHKDNFVAGGSEIYIPEEGVTAEVSKEGDVTVIALDGLEEIPETLDIVNGETSVSASREYFVRMEDTRFY